MTELDGETIQADGWLSDRVWLVFAGLITVVSAIYRFAYLTLKPLHHDEGVNGWFLTNLVRDGVYKYDPANYHGPTLYYLTLPFVEVFGLKTVPIRASVAIWGVLTVVLVLYLKNYLGRTGSLLAAAFVALAPGMVYISRYFIHEIFFVFLSLGLVVAVVFFVEKRKAGPAAIVWMALVLLTCFMPSVVNLGTWLGGESTTAVWCFRAAFFVGASALVFYLMRSLIGWQDGRPIYLLLASACVALLFATKETTFITLGTMAIACVCVWMWRPIAGGERARKFGLQIVIALNVVAAVAVLVLYRSVIGAWTWLDENFLRDDKVHEPFVLYAIVSLLIASAAAWVLLMIDLRRERSSESEEPVALTWSNFRDGLGRNGDRILLTAGVATLFIFLSVLFFSSFFTYKEGVSKAFEAYSIWTKTGSKDHTQNGPLAYLKWGMKVESPLYILGLLGSVATMLWARHRLAMFTALWGVGLLVAYTLIPYKTPWLALSFLLPMCISAGYALGQMLESRNIGLKIAACTLAVVGLATLAWEAYDLSFIRYDDEEMGYVYAHTKRGFNDLLAQIEHYADKSGKGKDATIEIVSPDYWPMTWYLNDYGHANFHGQFVEATTSEMIVAKKDAQDTAVIQKYSGHYKYVGVYPLRPGVNLILLVRRDLADATAQDPYKILEYESIPGYTN
jgi:predicted membrane-bound mannosyltransferase